MCYLKDKGAGKNIIVVGTWNKEEHIVWATKNSARSYQWRENGTQKVRYICRFVMYRDLCLRLDILCTLLQTIFWGDSTTFISNWLVMLLSQKKNPELCLILQEQTVLTIVSPVLLANEAASAEREKQS